LVEENPNTISHEEFFKIAVIKLRDLSKSRGIHSVFSGFNDAFRKVYNVDVVAVTQELAATGKIEIRPAKRGVMIYLPGEAPKSRENLGDKALEKIFGNADGTKQYDSLITRAIEYVAPEGPLQFPSDFLKEKAGIVEFFKIDLPGTPLQMEANSHVDVISPKHHFRYQAKNPSIAKYVLYSYQIGDKSLNVPKNNAIVFNAVNEYEKYCQLTKERSFSLFLKDLHDEDIAEMLAKEVSKRLNLRDILS
jgi:hypothetical protein